MDVTAAIKAHTTSTAKVQMLQRHRAQIELLTANVSAAQQYLNGAKDLGKQDRIDAAKASLERELDRLEEMRAKQAQELADYEAKASETKRRGAGVIAPAAASASESAGEIGSSDGSGSEDEFAGITGESQVCWLTTVPDAIPATPSHAAFP